MSLQMKRLRLSQKLEFDIALCQSLVTHSRRFNRLQLKNSGKKKSLQLIRNQNPWKIIQLSEVINHLHRNSDMDNDDIILRVFSRMQLLIWSWQFPLFIPGQIIVLSIRLVGRHAWVTTCKHTHSHTHKKIKIIGENHKGRLCHWGISFFSRSISASEAAGNKI